MAEKRVLAKIRALIVCLHADFQPRPGRENPSSAPSMESPPRALPPDVPTTSRLERCRCRCRRRPPRQRITSVRSAPDESRKRRYEWLWALLALDDESDTFGSRAPPSDGFPSCESGCRRVLAERHSTRWHTEDLTWNIRCPLASPQLIKINTYHYFGAAGFALGISPLT